MGLVCECAHIFTGSAGFISHVCMNDNSEPRVFVYILQEDFSPLTSALGRTLVENHVAGSDELALAAMTVLARLRELSGENSFNVYLQVKSRIKTTG